MESTKSNPEKVAVDHPAYNELMEKYKNLIEKIRPTAFDFVTEILKEENIKVKLDTDVLVRELKFNLNATIESNFRQTWEENDMNEQLIALDKLKSKARFSTAPQWRPTGKTPEEQVLPLDVNALQKKIEYFKKNIELQKQQIQVLVPEVEEKRNVCESFLKRRQEVSDNIDAETEKFQQIEENNKRKMELATKMDF